MKETETSDVNLELEHDDARGGFICGESIVGRDVLGPPSSTGASPDAPANPSAIPTALYDVEGRGYDGCVYGDGEPDPAQVTVCDASVADAAGDFPPLAE